MSTTPDDLDAPLYGAKAIAIAANIRGENGEPDLNRTYYLLEKGYLPAGKIGNIYTSTTRRLRKIAAGE